LAIASVERTGSTALCSILRQTGLAGTPIEYLNLSSVNFDRFRSEHGVPRIRADLAPLAAARHVLGRRSWRNFGWFSAGSWRDYLRSIAEVNATPNDVFGIKMHWSQYERHMLAVGVDVGFWDAPVSWARITRADEVRQAISFVRASQTASWNSDMRSSDEPWFDADAIAAALDHIEAENLAWDRHLAGREGVVTGREPVFAFTYEDLVADRVAVIGTIMAMLGERDVPVPEPGTRTQSDDLNRQWADRFVAERPEHSHRRRMAARTIGPDATP
jgi:LPS sulfotransferase NodH